MESYLSFRKYNIYDGAILFIFADDFREHRSFRDVTSPTHTLVFCFLGMNSRVRPHTNMSHSLEMHNLSSSGEQH